MPAASVDYQIILTKADFETWLARLQQSQRFAFDTETTSLNYKEAKLVGFSFALEPLRLPVCAAWARLPRRAAQLDINWCTEKINPF